MAEKYLEKIKKHKAKGHLDKAWQLAEEAFRQGSESPELDALSLGLSLRLQSWTEVLTRMKKLFKGNNFFDLCGGENRPEFIQFVHDYPGFRTGLSDYLCSVHAYQGIAEWVKLYDDYDQRWLIKNWINASEQVAVPVKQAALLVAAAVGHMVRKETEETWQLLIQAVGVDLALLPKIMSFMQNAKLLDMKSVPNRMQIIRMLLVAGRRKEALQLLLVMGCESEDNALKVLLAIPELFTGDTTHAVLELRFQLALFIKDPEILADVIGDMRALSEDQLFQFKKQATLKLDHEPELQRQMNLGFCRVYMAMDNWESAALILEGLFVEKPTDEVVDTMAEVLDNYPVMPELNFMVGQYYLAHQQVKKAIKYWTPIKELDDFRPKVKRFLEQRLIEAFDESCAMMLFDMLRKGSNRAGLLGFWILAKTEMVDQRFLGRMEHRLLPEEMAPMWILALIHGFARAENYPLLMEYLEHFLKEHQDLSAEVVRYAELLVENHSHEFTSLRQLLKNRAPHLVTGKVWTAILERFDAAAKHYNEHRSGPQPLRERSASVPSGSVTAGKSGDYAAYFEAFQERILTRNWSAAAELARKAAVHEPLWRQPISQQVNQLCENQPNEWEWTALKIELLLLDELLKDAEAVVLETLPKPQFKDHQTWLYQKLGEIKKTLGEDRDALSAFIFSSQDPENYRHNREILPKLVKAAGGYQFREVLNLILKAGDESIWKEMVQVWYEEKPGDLEAIVAAQLAFAEKVESGVAYLDLAHWQLQASNLEGFQQALKSVDLRKVDRAEPLEHLADLANLKYPDDPSAKFALGRFYTIHRQIPRAVDTFRNLVQNSPALAESVYHYLRSYLANQPESPDRVHLYGLLIRLALDHQLTLPAVRLLDEFSQLDQPGAERLAEGVNRVLLKDRIANREALIHFGSLLLRWKNYDRLLNLELNADFEQEMMTERLEWLAEIQDDPSLAPRASLQRARLFAAKGDFDACREMLDLVGDDGVRAEAANLYTKICQRFPMRLDVQYQAAWVFRRVDHPQTIDIWKRVFQHKKATPQQVAEAYAVLKEEGGEPDRKVLMTAFSENEDQMLGHLRKAYGRLREVELEVAGESDGSPTEPALAYLLESNQLERFQAWFSKVHNIDPHLELRLEARHLQRQGLVLEAARRVAYSDLPAEFRQSVLRDAGLIELAVVVNPVGERLAPALRSAFASLRNQPRTILARSEFLARSKKKQAIREAQTVMLQTS